MVILFLLVAFWVVSEALHVTIVHAILAIVGFTH